MPAKIKKQAPADTLRQVNIDFLANCYSRGMGLSAMLETLDPSSEYPNERTDAFQRLMAEAGIVTRSFGDLGLAADTVDDFTRKCEAAGARDAGHVLLVEHFARAWKSVGRGAPINTRALYTAADQPIGSVSNPYVDTARPYWNKQIAPQIPIAAIVAMSTPIDNDSYRAFYLTDDPANARMVRVTEFSEIPGAKLVGGDREIRLYKYGRKLVMSYEQMRRMRIDQVSMHIQRLAVQAEIDKLDTILDVFVNGDGNANTAASSFDLTTLDAATTANNLTEIAWLTFKAKFKNPYMMDTVLGQEGPIIKLQVLDLGTANIPHVFLPAGTFGSLRPINPQLGGGQSYGITDGAPASKLLGFDTRMGIEQITEVGATIQEVQRFIANQTEALTMTETEGYRVIDQNSHKILNLAA
ncbi:MAG: hypothetical protein AB7U82_27620 [Blastocatellales bacterium]